MSLGPTELILIVLAAVVLFGARKLPELGRHMGQGLREFRRGTRELKEDLSLNVPEAGERRP